MEPRIQYCTTSDGVSIAYAALGEGPAIVFAPTIWGDLYLYASRAGGHQKTDALIERGWQVILYDGRGCGYSDRLATDFSLEARLLDLDAVIGALGVNRPVLCGRIASGLTAIAYAARYPERISRLALINAHARGADLVEAMPSLRATSALMGAVAAEQWEFFTLNLANAITGFSDSDRARRQAAIYHESMSPEAYLAHWQVNMGIDVTPLLASVRTPTLVVHDKSDPIGDFSPLTRGIASRIAGARLVATEDSAAAVDQFLRESGEYTPIARATTTAVSTGALVTILFTDVEGSTALTDRLGDAAARDVLREHERITREALKAHGGSEVKTMGDGFMASFGSATKALECAVAIQKSFAGSEPTVGASHSAPPRVEPGRPDERNVVPRRDAVPGDSPLRPEDATTPLPARGEVLVPRAEHNAPIRVRIGLNAGEPIAEQDDLFGTAVIVAARIAAQAQGAEILVSDVVRQLVAGKGFLFDDRGEQALKGFEDPVRVYELRWREDA